MLGVAYNGLAFILSCWLCVCEHIFPSLWVLDCLSVKWERLGPMVCLEGSSWSGSLGQLRAKTAHISRVQVIVTGKAQQQDCEMISHIEWVDD